jgi:hypothetical protein
MRFTGDAWIERSGDMGSSTEDYAYSATDNELEHTITAINDRIIFMLKERAIYTLIERFNSFDKTKHKLEELCRSEDDNIVCFISRNLIHNI